MVEVKYCCEQFEKIRLSFQWFTYGDEEVHFVMPCIDNVRVNYCPSCGKYIREIDITEIEK